MSLRHQSEYEKHLQAQGYGQGAVKVSRRASSLFAGYLKTIGSTPAADPRDFDSKTITGFYEYLKNYRYTKADNRLGGFQKEPEKRNYKSYPLKEGVVRSYLVYLRRFFLYLLESERIYANPFEKLVIKGSRGRSLKEDVTEWEIDVLSKVIDTITYLGFRNRTIFEILYGTGLRRAEAAALDVESVNLNEGIITVSLGKGRKDRLVPLGQVALGYVKEYVKEVRKNLIAVDNLHEKALFLNRRGKRLSKGSIGLMIQKYARTAGLFHVTTHKLRHSFSLHMMRQGCDIRFLQAILGHANLETTTVYTEVYDHDLREKIKKFHPDETLRI